MAWSGYFMFGGTELINATRTEAYARHLGVQWFRPVYNEAALPWLLDEAEYTTPLQDDAPWTDPDNLDSYDFYGAYPLEVTGIEDGTTDATVTESVVDGGYIGRTRKKTRTVVYSAILAGASECAVEYGMRWLRGVLTGGPCFNQSYGACGGADLCYLACPPIIDDVEPKVVRGPWAVDRANLSANPAIEVSGADGWSSSDAAKYPVSASTVEPIGGTRSILSARIADLLAATNLVVNPNLNGGSILGWNGNNGALYPIALDTTAPISGSHSVLATRTATSPSANAASINLINGSGGTYFPVVAGQPVTASIDVKCEQADRIVTFYCEWLNGGTSLGIDTSTNYRLWGTGAANQVNRVNVTGIPAAGATQMRLYCSVFTKSGNALTGERVWFDNLRVSTGPGTLNSTNNHPNPGLTQGTLTYWNTASGTLYPTTVDAASAMTGTYSALQTRASTLSRFTASMVLGGAATPGSNIPCTPGTPVYAAVDIKAELAGRRCQTYFQWFDVAGASLGNSPLGTFVPLTAGAVVRVTQSATPPAGAVMCRAVFSSEVTDLSNATLGERTWYDNAYVGADPTTPAFHGGMSPDGTYVYRWTGGSTASTSQRWAVTGTEQADATYFDGSTPATSQYVYTWTGAANASTSRRSAVSDSTAASLTLAPSAASPSFAVTAGTPVTFSVDVKVERADRQVSGRFAWIGAGVSTPVTIPAGPPGSVVRLVVTATPPEGVTTCQPVVSVTSGTGLPLVGERVWFDHLVVERGQTDGSYFDGDTPDTAITSHLWTGAAGASTSERSAPTYITEPVPTAEDCYNRIGRSLHEVTCTVGPTVTQKLEMVNGGAVWQVTWTMVAANPAEFGVEKPLILGFLDPDVDIPYYGGVVPPGGDFDENGNVQTDAPCAAAVFRPIYDPTCALLSAPPAVPSVIPMCFSFPVNFLRTSFTIPREEIPLWTTVTPVVSLTTKTAEARSVRVRFYADMFDTGDPSQDPCNYCGDVVFSYVPPSSTIVLDCADREVYIDQPGIGRRRADALVTNSKGEPFEWPEFSCGYGYVVTVDMPQQMTQRPIVDLSLVPRMV